MANYQLFFYFMLFHFLLSNFDKKKIYKFVESAREEARDGQAERERASEQILAIIYLQYRLQ